MSSKKKQLLDPIGTICRIIGIKFRKKKTKFGITNHSIVIQEPYEPINIQNMIPVNMQSVARWLNNDDKNNISELYASIIRVVEWYVIPLQSIIRKTKKNGDNKYLNVEDEEEARKYYSSLDKLCIYFCAALNDLQITYNDQFDGNTVLAIQFFINIIQDAMTGSYDANKLPKCFIVQPADTLLDYDKIRELWNYKKISEISQEYDKCFQLADSNDENKEKKIHGYLMVIDEFLNISENSFRKLIESSNKG